MNQYANDLLDLGYCVIPKLTSKDVIADMRSEYLQIFNNKEQQTLSPIDFLKIPSISNLIFNENIINGIKSVIGNEFCLYPDFTIRENLYIPWHTDTSYLISDETDSHDFADMIQMSIYLQDNTSENGGGLEIIPMSHRFKNLNRICLSENKIDYSLKKLMPSNAGDLVFWDSRLIHKSSHDLNQNKKYALQWTISRTENFAHKYLSYLEDRCASRRQHVSDKIGHREANYLQGVKEVKFPFSFSEAQLKIIEKYNLKVKTIS